MFLTGDEDPGLLGMPRAPEETHRSLEMMPAGDGALPAAPLELRWSKNAMDQKSASGSEDCHNKVPKTRQLKSSKCIAPKFWTEVWEVKVRGARWVPSQGLGGEGLASASLLGLSVASFFPSPYITSLYRSTIRITV